MSTHDDETESVRAISEHNDAIVSSRSAPPSFGDGDYDTPPTKPHHFIPEPKIVMLVEDDRDIRESVRDTLLDERYALRHPVFQVWETSNGDEALKMLEREYLTRQYLGKPAIPDLILLDLMMPVMSGWNFYATLRRAHPMFDVVPVLIMSADTRIHEFQQWVVSTEGLDVPRGALPKPISQKHLLEKVYVAVGLAVPEYER